MFTKNHNRYLVEEGISLVRKHAKFFALKDMTNEDYIECKLSLLSKVVSISNIQYTVNIFIKVAKSQCIEKSAYILDLIMKARLQNHFNQQYDSVEERDHFYSGFLKFNELSSQQRELLILGDELTENITDINSPFQNFLKHSPDALNSLFDQCLVKPCDLQIQGETFFDFFLFKADQRDGSEMRIFTTLITGCKERFLLHPLFDAFIKLKWSKMCDIFYFYVCWVMLYQIFLTIFSLNKFDNFCGEVTYSCLRFVIIIFFVTLCSHSLNELLISASWIHNYLLYADRGCLVYLIPTTLWQLVWHMSHPVLCGLFLFGNFDDTISRSICAVLIFMASFQSMEVLAQIPKIGMQSLMVSKVCFSVFNFFSSFGSIFFSFCVIFHILLPDSVSFQNLGNAVIKVLTMLMGELDFTNSFLNSNANFVTKIFFVLFLISMALVFMNLLLGLAVSDIGELERISRVRRAVVEYHAVATMEKILMNLRLVGIFPYLYFS